LQRNRYFAGGQLFSGIEDLVQIASSSQMIALEIPLGDIIGE
jgi:hypothetical protein